MSPKLREEIKLGKHFASLEAEVVPNLVRTMGVTRTSREEQPRRMTKDASCCPIKRDTLYRN